jgi:hypothetical protein
MEMQKKTIPVTGSGVLCGVTGREPHIVWTIGFQVLVSLSVSRLSRALPQKRFFWYSFLLEAE